MFIDANVFIHAFQDRGTREAIACRKLLLRISDGEQRATTSALVVEEVLHFFLENRGRPFSLKVLRSITSQPNLTMLPADERALRLIPEFVDAGLDSADSLHAAVMKANGEATICSFDRGFDSAPGIRRKEP